MFSMLRRAFFGDITDIEVKKYGLLSMTFLFTIGTYWLLRPLKDGIFFNFVGRSYQPDAKIYSLFVVLVAVAFYQKLVDLFEKHTLFYVLGGMYVFLFAGITYFLGHPTIGLANTVPDKGRIFGWVIYFIVESFGSIVIPLFWSFIASIIDAESAKKGFPIIVAGGQIGGVAGPFLAFNAKALGSRNLFALSVILCLGMIMALAYFVKVMPAGQLVSTKQDALSTKKPKTGFFEGLKLIFTRSYLFGIFAVISLYEIVTTIIDFQLKTQASMLPEYSTVDSLTSFMGMFGMITNGFAFLLALLGTSYLMRKFGLVFCLLTFPIAAGASVIGLYYTSAMHGVGAHTLLWVTFTVMVIVKGLSYALNNPSKDMMYIPTSKDAKFKSKSWIDGFGGRSAKAEGSLINKYLLKPFLSDGVSTFMAYGAITSLGLIGLWITAALFVGRQFVVLTKENKIVE